MEAKQAIETAKTTLREMFADEILGDVKLEEVEFETQADVWAITLGFQRKFTPTDDSLATMLQMAARNATMKVVRVPHAPEGSVSIKNFP